MAASEFTNVLPPPYPHMGVFHPQAIFHYRKASHIRMINITFDMVRLQALEANDKRQEAAHVLDSVFSERACEEALM